jgi:hypothetical protein
VWHSKIHFKKITYLVVISLKSNYQPTLDWTMPLDPIIPYFNDQMYIQFVDSFLHSARMEKAKGHWSEFAN